MEGGHMGPPLLQRMNQPDAVVVGSGPNGLAAAITIAQTGRKVIVFEAGPAIGGGVSSAELTLPGFVHDVCSAVHPMAVQSPFFRTLPLAALGPGAMAHVAGWRVPRGGAQKLPDALAAHLRSRGGEIAVDSPIESIDDLPPAKAILCDVSPRPLLRMAGHRFPDSYRRALERYRYGPGAFKVDWALDAPIPWRAAACS